MVIEVMNAVLMQQATTPLTTSNFQLFRPA